MLNKEHTSFRQKSGVLAIKEHWCLSEDTHTGVRRLLKLCDSKPSKHCRKYLNVSDIGYWFWEAMS